MRSPPAATPPGHLPPFVPRAPWWGGDLQTLRNQLVGARADLAAYPSERFYLALADGSGDRLAAMLNLPNGAADRPLAVLIHGLTGCEDSVYIRASAAAHLRRGRPVLRLNLRGAGPSRPSSGGHYHVGCASDIRDALAALDPALLRNGMVLVGYSLGGNAVIRFLAEYAAEFPVLSAATVSAPIEPGQAVQRIMAPRNAIYHHWLLRRMKAEATAAGARLTAAELAAIVGARTVYEFDRDFIGPRNGYRGADDYYADNAGVRFVPRISVHTLIIHAHDDPWISAAPYESLVREHPPNVRIELTRGGGHVGFHARRQREAWHDVAVAAFVGDR